ncbi:MAG: SUMF1/EgtB/PvdO family nonheme iron enzyme [Myxococcota bacterium]
MAEPLSTCLAELFTVKELERWVSEHFPHLILHISFEGARKDVAFNVVQTLERHMAFDRGVLERIVAARPLKADKIRQAFNDTHAGHHIEHQAIKTPDTFEGDHPAMKVAGTSEPKLSETVRRHLISTLADLDVFHNAPALRSMVKSALVGVHRGPNLLRNARFDGRPLDIARALVVQTERLGTPPGDFLARILKELWDDAAEDQQLLVLTAALEQLEGPVTIPRHALPPRDSAAEFAPQSSALSRTDRLHHDGPTVMVSYRLVDIDQVRPVVDELRAQGVNVVWDQDQSNDSDIPVWVWATYLRADWILLACSEAYDRAIKELLHAPHRVPKFGKGVAQEARFMAIEHLHSGPERFVPVLLPGARPEHVPLVAKGKFTYALPDQQHLLIEHLRHPRDTQLENNDGQTQKPSPPTALDAARQKHVEAWQTAADKRHERFIELDLMPTVDGPMQPQTFTSLEALMNAVEEPAVLLVGDPGAGKTTLLQHLRYELSQADLGQQDRHRIVFLLPLAEYPKRQPPPLRDWFEARFARDYPQLGRLDARLASGEVWLLLDGLNEMPFRGDPRARFDDLRDVLVELPPANRVVISCRSQDVVASLGEVRRAEVKPLSEDAVRRFLSKYAPEKATRAAEELKQHDLLELYQNPYRLSLLIDELLETGEIPTNRAALFSTMVRRALCHNLRKPSARGLLDPFISPSCRQRLDGGHLPDAFASSRIQGDLLLRLSHMAFEGQLAGPGEHRRWTDDEALKALHPTDESRASALLQCGQAILVLEEQLDGDIRFAHQQLQEYFAARHWVRTSDKQAFEQATKGERVGDPKLGEALETIVQQLRPNETLPRRPATGWEETAVMAVSLARDDTFVTELAARDLVTAGRAASLANSGVSRTTHAELQKQLAVYLHDPAIELRTRLDAGLALESPEVLGFERRTSTDGIEYLWPPTYRLEAGEYPIGSADDDELAYNDEKPAYTFRLANDILLAQYPVTNAEFALFMKAGGYDNKDWWPEGEARSWWMAKREDTQAADRARELRGWSESQVEQFVQQWGWSEAQQAFLRQLRQGSWEEAVAALRPAQHPALDRHPQEWHNRNFNRSLQPVVGICVFEAEAYIRWLSHVSGDAWRLPSEEEWEAAARRSGGPRWSYGSEANPIAANTLDLRFRTTSPVGAFTTNNRINWSDLSGNMWEWTSSSWTAKHKAAIQSEYRVVRGGSWFNPVDLARGACRLRNPLDSRNSYSGFRLCSGPPVGIQLP